MDTLPAGIASAVRTIKSAIVKAQSRVAANANAEMLLLYFGIGQYVSRKTKTEKWGTGVIDTISAQLQKEMPGLRGFSARSIHKMRHFYEIWSKSTFLPPVAAKLESHENASVILPPPTAEIITHEFLPPLAAEITAGACRISAKEFLAISFFLLVGLNHPSIGYPSDASHSLLARAGAAVE